MRVVCSSHLSAGHRSAARQQASHARQQTLVSQSPQGFSPRDPGLLRGAGPTSPGLGRREASPAMYGDDAAVRGRSRCVARRPRFRHIMRLPDLAPIWSRMPGRRCCARPAPWRSSPTCAGTSSGRRMVASRRLHSLRADRCHLAAVDSGGSAQFASRPRACPAVRAGSSRPGRAAAPSHPGSTEP
jgi:hypothetical protein